MMRSSARRLALLCLAVALAAPSEVHAVGAPSPGAANAGTVKLPSGPASVAGLADNASLSPFTGQVTYSIPIDLPASRAGFRPSMAVAYNGALGNGPLGIGWSIVAPHIRRNTRLGVPSYTPADELELVGVAGGGRLVLVTSGVYQGEYRLEGQGNAVRILQLSADKFTVQTSAGTKYTFLSRQMNRDGTQVFSWYLSTVEALHGQVAYFEYQDDLGEVYLSAVRWGYPASVVAADITGATPSMFEATLTYESRTDRVTSYRPGARVETA